MSEVASPNPNSSPQGQGVEQRPLVFLGGINYDQARNERVGAVLVGMSSDSYSQVLTLPDHSPDPTRDDTAHFTYDTGHTLELPTKLAMKQLNDPAVTRFTALHQRRARALIDTIESAGSGPVDAVFQSIDTSTGILAMHQRPDLFRRVVLVDPSSIVKHPTRAKFFKEEFKSGNMFRSLRKPKPTEPQEQFEHSLTPFEAYKRMKKTARFGNMNATYLSAQAKQLHEVAQSAAAPIITVVASSMDHAYSPKKVLESLVDINDIAALFITNARHGINGKTQKLTQVMQALQTAVDPQASLEQKITFADGITEKYRTQIAKLLGSIKK